MRGREIKEAGGSLLARAATVPSEMGKGEDSGSLPLACICLLYARGSSSIAAWDAIMALVSFLSSLWYPGCASWLRDG